MRRVPIFSSLIVAAAVAVMIGLGVWQIQRAGEKAQMLAALESTRALPPLDLAAWPAEGGDLSALAYRRARIDCPAPGAPPTLEGGRSRDGRGGYVHVVPCGHALGGRLRIVIGWAALPMADPPLWTGGVVTGRLGGVRSGQPIRLVADSAAPGLAPAALPSTESIQNNHIAYAGQWFFFAAAAAAIYVLALRRRRRSDLPDGAGAPKGTPR